MADNEFTELTQEQLAEIGATVVDALNNGGEDLRRFDEWYRNAIANLGHSLNNAETEEENSAEFVLPDDEYASENEIAIAKYLSKIGSMVDKLGKTVSESLGKLENTVKVKAQSADMLADLRERTGIKNLTVEDIEEAIRETGINHPYYALVEKHGLGTRTISGEDAPLPSVSFDFKKLLDGDKWEVVQAARNPRMREALADALNDRRQKVLQKQLEEGKVPRPGTVPKNGVEGA